MNIPINIFIQTKYLDFVIFLLLQTLNQFSCVTLGGLVAELLVAGNSDGHLADILKV